MLKKRKDRKIKKGQGHDIIVEVKDCLEKTPQIYLIQSSKTYKDRNR